MPELINPLEPVQPVTVRTYTIVTYLYPKRNPAYAHFAEIVPRKKNPEALRQILLKGWEQARDEIDEWIAKSGGWDAHHKNAYDEAIDLPIPEGKGKEKLAYKLYLKNTETYIPILEYMAKLPSGFSRQRFVLLALVRGLEREGTLDTVRSMLAQKGT